MSNIPPQRCRCAFTLLELLVVVAIVALLVSIIMPSMQSCRGGRRVKCLANLRDLMAASFAYAAEDRSGVLVPVLAAALRDTAHLSASRRAFGGTAGWHDIGRPEANSPHGGAAMFCACNGFGPDQRPLNQLLYRSGLEPAAGTGSCCASRPSGPDLPVFRCPSDLGYRSGFDGTTGIYLYGGSDTAVRDFKEPGTLYEVTGNSYACDSLLTGPYSTCPTHLNNTSHGVFLRNYDQIPFPCRTTVYVEGNGFYAAQWNSWAPLSGDPEAYTMGNHGTLREHNVAFADGHAVPVRFEVRTAVAEAFDDGTLRRSADFALRGGTTPELRGRYNTDPRDPAPLRFSGVAPLLLSGPDWTQHTYPAPGVWIN